MKYLDFERPKKVMSTEEWLNISADSAPPGVYSPNMSAEDLQKYKAKCIGGEVPRIEIRVSHSCEVLVKVKNQHIDCKGAGWGSKIAKLAHEHGAKNIKMSMNGAMELTYEEWEVFKAAIDEAVGLVKS